jgi:hypothetical protein
MKRLLIRLLFSKFERQLIAEAVIDYCDFPDDVRDEDWYEKQQSAADNIVMKVT